MRNLLRATALLIMTAPAAMANTSDDIIAYVKSEVAPWVQSDVVIAAVKAQNAQHEGLSEAEVIAMDNTWRGEIDSGNHQLISDVLGREVSAYLSDMANATGGQITEVFVMDNLGLNVGQSAITSDYWQGDEAKFQKTYPMGPDALHISEIELDESTQTYQAQVSMTVIDPGTGTVIGAVTFGVNANSFF